MIKFLRHSNLGYMLPLDGLLVVMCFYLAYLFRFEFSIPPNELSTFAKTWPYVLVAKMGIFALFHLYRGMWRYTSLEDLVNVMKAVFTSSILIILGVIIIQRFQGHPTYFFILKGFEYPRSIFIIDGCLTFLAIGGLRVIIRLYFTRQSNLMVFPSLRAKNREDNRKRILIIGAGDAGEKAVREIRDNPRLRYSVVAFLDDDSQKIGRSIHNVPVVGDLAGLEKAAKKLNVDEVLIAIPSAASPLMRRILEGCKECGVPFKTLPGMGELIEGKISIKALRDVDYQDLLGRSPVELDEENIRGYLENKRVLVTGPGGSIGSELCRQMVRFNPENLILLDAAEANLYGIEMELKYDVAWERYSAILGSVQDGQLLDKIFGRYQPQVVFHAAAYKHVSMMELNPWQAVHNNIRGSEMIMEKAIRHGVDHFVLVSTDKAVRPHNVMGASKRVAELLLQAYAGNHTRMMAVRFGNVVGSSGSVIPLFRRQIARGGPVTVSHKDVTRFFMTISEACQLILQTGALGADGDIFILEMGTPIKILDMARDLIHLSGKEPGRDIQIEFKGLEPGEKLYEELITEGEGIVPTEHEKIMVLKADGKWNGYGDQGGFRRWLMEGVEDLYKLADQQDGCAIRAKLKELVQEYTPQEMESVF
jgi:FlaA1/EpsC-like NDP-sugar epimerase